MKPIGPLMLEHRTIERMVKVLELELSRIRISGVADVDLLLRGVDFFRTYADRTHHGKEEDILFRELKKKKLGPELKLTMDKLYEDHRVGREHVKGLLSAANSYRSGNKGDLERIIAHLGFLVDFYPKHIVLEDAHFFFPCQELFTREESDRMLKEFWEFDRRMVHEKYERDVAELEQRYSI